MRRLFYLFLLLILPHAAPAQELENLAEMAELDDRGFIQSLIEDGLSDTSRSVRLVNFEGALSTRATIDAITVADEQGIWLTLTDVAIDWDRAAVLSGAINIQELSAETIEISRRPIREDTAPRAEANTEENRRAFTLPDLPVSFEARNIEAGTIILGETVLGEPLQATFSGDLSLIEGVGIADLRLERTDGKLGRFVIDTSYSRETRQLSLLLEAEEGENGIAARMLNLPGRPSAHLAIVGDAPIDDFAARVALATDGQDRFTGDVTFDAGAQAGADGTRPDRFFTADLSGDIRPLLQEDFRGFFGPLSSLVVEGTAFGDGRLVLSALNIEAAEIALTGSLELANGGWPDRFALDGRVGNDTGRPGASALHRRTDLCAIHASERRLRPR